MSTLVHPPRTHHPEHLAYPPRRRGTIAAIAIVAISLSAVTIALVIPRDQHPPATTFAAERIVWADDTARLHVYDIARATVRTLAPWDGGSQAAVLTHVADDELRWFETTQGRATLRSVPLLRSRNTSR